MQSFKKRLLFLFAFIALYIISIFFVKNIFASWGTDLTPPNVSYTGTCVGGTPSAIANGGTCNGTSATIVITFDDSTTGGSGINSVNHTKNTVPATDCTPAPGAATMSCTKTYNVLNTTTSYDFTAEATDNAGNANSSPFNFSFTFTNTIVGNVYRDASSNSCASGSTVYGAGIVSLYDGAILYSSPKTVTAAGYTFNSVIAGNDYSLTLTGIPVDYIVVAVRTNISGSFFSNSNSYGAFNSPNITTVDFCINNTFGPWFQTDKGDVRMPRVVNNVPAGRYATVEAGSPSLFISSSSTSTSDFGSGSSSSKNWNVNTEYGYNNPTFASAKGITSYTYYKSRADQLETTINLITTLPISNLTTGIYKYDGNLAINSYSHTAGARVIILVNGDVTINSNIIVPSGANNLLIIAAKGDIKVDSTVGTIASDDNKINAQLQGIFTAEGDFILEGNGTTACGAANQDKRLNIAGSVISNSLEPFTTGGQGNFDISARTLCSDDANYPVAKIYARPDFLTQLTDFYKTSETKWQEVNP